MKESVSSLGVKADVRKGHVKTKKGGNGKCSCGRGRDRGQSVRTRLAGVVDEEPPVLTFEVLYKLL